MVVTRHLLAPSIAQRVEATRKHLAFSIKWKGEKLGILEMRRHYSNYFKGLPNFKEYRMRLVYALEWQDISDILDEVSVVFDGYLLEKQLVKVEYAGID